MTHLIIFTDLDGTLFRTAPDDATLAMLQKLNALNIPVIPVTRQTRAEVETRRRALGLTTPFITENGSGIFIPRDTPFQNPPGELDGDYYVIDLGCPYVQTRAGLRVIANTLHYSLLGFGDLTIERLQKRTDLSETAVQQAKACEFSEPFITPKGVNPEALTEAVKAVGFQVILDEPFSYLIGPDASTEDAIAQLVTLYQSTLSTGESFTTVGLGHSSPSLPLLKSVDIPIIIPNADGPHPKLAKHDWQIAPTSAPDGWITAINTTCQKLGIEL
ncbi:MAG: HAD hydrolase family protein [Cyanobacteria bacterium P01_G01_bin.38]